ncbi:hypothetical protein [Pseudorhodoferax sp.]|uniref:hypothetical protein n=1 Tax=Pseudorhodoferax sp. TaxID=1993553 RepID=UPI002DD66684|nr:hypothetical protein [Pseudorhodoferax sp.]
MEEEERGYDATLEESAPACAPAAPIGSVTGYAAAGKAKARSVCQAFVDGAGGGRVLQPPPRRLQAGAAVFFGVTEPSQHLWRQAQREGRDWYYLDNAYFDAARGRAFRAVRNAVQARGDEPPDWPRFARLGLRIMPWRRSGRHVLLVLQSATHMQVVAGKRADWGREALQLLARHTDRPVVVRGWRSNKMALAATLAEALQDCWALVTWSSAAANEALLAGVPVFTLGPCAASALALADLRRIESPLYAEGRARWAAALAGRQWTLEELRAGIAWRTLQS